MEDAELYQQQPMQTAPIDNNSNSSDAHEQPQQQRRGPPTKSSSIALTREERQLFQLMIRAAEAYERGELTVDPDPPRSVVSPRGGFHANTNNNNNANNNNNNNSIDSANAPSSLRWNPPPRVDRIAIRVAGGWVRDRLLDRRSSDVDVALDCMTGVQFARILQAYIMNSNAAEGGDDDGDVVGVGSTNNGNDDNDSERQRRRKQPKIGVIGANPDQSKHLETATMNIHGMDIDFVNLRAEEVYDSDSRIPTLQTRNFGSPLEDALRRDFTINSLFYNVRTNEVEDWTGRGLDDLLIHKRIVTPIDAHSTFHDDPLRVLRAIRFAVRLNFALDDNLIEAAMSIRVHRSLHAKVSRERVGKELEGMLTGKAARPRYALEMIADLHLAGSVFCFPGSFLGDDDVWKGGGTVTGDILGEAYRGCLGREDDAEAYESAARQRKLGWDESRLLLTLLPGILEGYYRTRDSIVIENGADPSLLPSNVDERLLYLCVFIMPFRNLSYPDAKGRESSVTSHMIKESLKFATRDIQGVSTILNGIDEMAALLSEIRTSLSSSPSSSYQEEQGRESQNVIMELTPPCRLRTGLLLRSLKQHWVTCLLASAAWEMRSIQRQHADGNNTNNNNTPSAAPCLQFYQTVIKDLSLDGCWQVRPHLNGKEIISELQLPRGPVVGVYIDEQVRWMLLNPDGTREECVAHLHERKRARELLECNGETTTVDMEDDHKRQCVAVNGR